MPYAGTSDYGFPISMYLFTDNRKSRKHRGVALIIVIGVVGLLSWFAIEILARIREEITVRGYDPRSTDQLRGSAFQALELSMAVLAEIRELDNGLYSQAQGWGDILTYAGISENLDVLGNASFRPIETSLLPDDSMALAFPQGVTVRIRISDRTGRFPLNNTPESRWHLIFEELGFESNDAYTLTDSLLDWIDPDNEPRLYGAERDHYQQKEPPYEPRNASIPRLSELRLIQGFDALFFDERGQPNEHYWKLSTIVTTYRNESINYNAANALVLQILEEEEGLPAEALQEFRQGEDGVWGTLDDRVLRPEMTLPDLPTYEDGSPLDLRTQSRYVSISIQAGLGLFTYRLNVVLDLSRPHSGGVYPFEIVHFREEALAL